MDYKTLLGLAKADVKFEKIKVEGGETDGHLLIADCSRSSRRHYGPRKELGKSYAKKFQEEDEMEDIILKKAVDRQGNDVTGIEDLTSLGTLPNINEIFVDQLTQVYENYSFNYAVNNELLIHTYKDKILEEIEQNEIVIIKGQTGCGKTTQVPQYILDSCRLNNMHCNIVVTQPRKIAAISIAKRVCQERNWELGSLVGYQVSLEKEKSEDTRLLYCTAGCLLQTIISKQNLSSYTHIIIDEIHERDNETDFLLIIIKKLLRTPGNRTKVILMSATINVDKFVKYFTKKVKGIKVEPPVIELETKTNYPVHYFYIDSLADRIPLTMPLLKLTEPRIDTNAYQLAAILVEVFHTIDDHEHSSDKPFLGSVLIFLPGLHEIETMYETLTKKIAEKKIKEQWILCPLHSTVTNDEQSKVFKRAGKGERKIILATNIAESSITVPDVKYVIDFCLMKIQVQERETSYSSLQLCWASKSQAIQRAGRVGRVMPGRVYRLVPETLYKSFQDDCCPEILRCPLDTLVLKAKELDMGPPSAILGRAMDPPDLSNIQTNILSLKEMGALLLTTEGRYEEFDGDLTFIGKVMASLPIDPYLSKLIIFGHMFSCLDECIIMASAMAVKSIFSTPFRKQLEAYTSKLRWANFSSSDPISFLNAYKLWRHKTTSGLFKRTGGVSEELWAKKFFIQLKSLKEVAKLENEITNRLKRLGISTSGGMNKVHWTDHELPLVLKITLAGAFYPNYFLRNHIDEKEAVKVLGGRDPFSTVYLSNMPTNQPGPLYIAAIKQHFYNISTNINVSFDGSSKIYLTFDGSCNSLDDSNKTVSMRTPGTISLAVYKAIKMRHLQIPITISVLPPVDARKRATKIFGETLTPNIYCWNKKQERPVNKSLLPGLATSVLPITLTHVNSPGHFFCHINDEATSHRHAWLDSELNLVENRIPLKPENYKVGYRCIAPYVEENDTAFYRATILSVDLKESLAQIVYIDYGNESEMNVRDLCDYADRLVKSGVCNEPPLALECRLAEIQPSPRMNPKGYWSKEAIGYFTSYFKLRSAIALIYSVVNSVMAVTMYRNDCVESFGGDFKYESSFNHRFVQKGYAEMAEEPYLSREDHVNRNLAQKSPGVVTYTPAYLTDDPYGNINFEPPSEKECLIKVHLKGPRSPLEMSLYSLAKKCQGKEINIEWNSVNSVLLDNVPMDMHDRMMIAANVTQSATADRLTLRNTTFLPNMHGLPSLILLMFSPKIELRTDPDREVLTGALCGLGFDTDTGESYHPENDIEMMFDTKFDLDDIENINKLRFWMNYIVHKDDNIDAEMSSCRVFKAQTKIKEYLHTLLNRTRPSMAQTMYDNNYAWDQLHQDILLKPLGAINDSTTKIYPLISGIDLCTNTKVSKVEELKSHLEQLQNFSDGAEVMRNGIKCELCQ